jgi:hypothetical protein
MERACRTAIRPHPIRELVVGDEIVTEQHTAIRAEMK